MKSGSVNICLGEQAVSLQTTVDLVARLIAHFLYFRGQIEKPLDQLKDENKAPTKMQLQYCERSTPYQHKGNVMFATPLNCMTPARPKSDVPELLTLTEAIENFSIHEEREVLPILETPLTTRTGNVGNKRRVLGKLQQVSVPITPTLNLKQSKSKDSISYLIQVIDQIKSHILNGWKVRKVLLIIGTTPMSPRESYTIDLSTLELNESPDTDKGRCLRKIMQSLFIDSFLNNLPPSLPLSNCYFILQVDRKCVEEAPSAFFEPRLRFYLNSRGLKFSLNLTRSADDATVEDNDDLYLVAPRPFRGVKTFTGNTPCANTEHRPRDFLDTIRA